MKHTPPLPSIEEILRKDRAFKEQLDRAMENDAKARLAKIMRAQFPAGERVSRSAWMSGPHWDELHVWLHVTDDGEPFFVGRGRGATAWERNGGLAWDWFVREELGGSYHVVIPASDLDERSSQILVDGISQIRNKKPRLGRGRVLANPETNEFCHHFARFACGRAKSLHRTID